MRSEDCAEQGHFNSKFKWQSDKLATAVKRFVALIYNLVVLLIDRDIPPSSSLFTKRPGHAAFAEQRVGVVSNPRWCGGDR